MSENVARIHPEADLQDPTDITPKGGRIGGKPALGMSIQVDLGAGRVCTLQTFVSSDCSLPELNKMLDKMTDAGARQRAIYRVEELERDLEKFEKEHAQAAEDLADVDRRHQEEQAKRGQSLASAEASLGRYETTAKEEHEASGKRTPFEMKGQVKVNADRVKGGVDKLKGEIAAAEEESKRVRAEIEKMNERRAALIAKTRAELARCKEIQAAGLKA